MKYGQWLRERRPAAASAGRVWWFVLFSLLALFALAILK